MATISDMVIKIGADASGLSSGLKKAQGDIEKTFSVNPVNEFSNALTGTTGKVDKLIGSLSSMAKIAATGFGLTNLITGAVEAGESTYQLANRLHISYAEAGEFSRILKMTGEDASTCGSAFMRLDKTLLSDSEAGEKARAVLDAVGVSLQDGTGKLLPLNEQLKNLSEGYKKASDAGYGQEFILNTLGARGMSLTKTLLNYAEAAQNASKIKSIGIDPEEMHRISQEMKVLEMQAGQLKNVGGAVFAPLASDVFPPILEGLSKAAKYVAENKEQLKALAKTGLEVVAVYKSIQAASKISAGISGAWQAAKAAQMAKNAPQADPSALTAAQEKSIARRMRNLDKITNKEIRDMEKTVAKMALSEEEKVRLATTSAMQIEQAAAKRATQEQLYMTKMYRETNLQAARSAEAQVAAMQTVRVASSNTAVQMVGDHAKIVGSTSRVVISNEAVIASERAKGAAAQESAGASVLANDRAILSNEARITSTMEAAGAEIRLAEASTAAGGAAMKAGAQSVAAHEASAGAARIEAGAVGGVAAAHTAAGTAAMGAGTTTVRAMGTATSMVKSATSAVFALAGGWLGVAAAIGYATYKLSEYGRAQQAEKDAHTYHLDGVEYIERDGRFYRNGSTDESVEAGYTNSYVTDETHKGEMATGRTAVELQKLRVERNHETVESEAAAYEKWLHSGAPEAQAELERQTQNKNREDMERLEKELRDALNASGGGGESAAAAREKAAPAPTKYNVERAIGELAADIAAGHPQGEQWMGNITNNPAIQCDSYTANIYAEAGIDSIGGQSTEGVINDEAFRAAGAYHAAGGGYEPEAGDLVDFAGHVGIYMGDGMVNSRQSSGGVQTISMDEAEGYFGAVQGYGSLAEATGGRTVTESRSGTREEAEAARQAQEAARKLEQGKKDAVSLFQTMANGVSSLEDTSYMQDVQKIQQDVQDKRQQINKIKESGVSQKTVDILNKELDEYAEAMARQASEKQQAALAQVKDEAKRTNAEVLHDYEAMAEAEYEATVRRIEGERKEKEKEVMRDKKDWQSKAAVSEWYYAKLSAAEEKRRQDLKKAHEEYISYLQSEGKVAELVAHLGSPKGKAAAQETLDLKGQQELARAYVDIWNDAHESVYSQMATAMSTMNSTMAKSFEDVIMGTKSAKEAIADFGKSVIQMIVQIAAQRMAANIVGSLFGSAMGSMGGDSGGGSSGGSPLSNIFGSLFKFADGGIVTAPTLGLIGEKGYSEAVIPLTRGHMEKLGIAGQKESVRPIQVIVQTPDATSFRRSEAQIAASVRRAVTAGQRFS